MSAINFSSHAAFIWSVADLLRGDYKQSDYGKVILPFTVLRRLDCVLEATKPAVLKAYEARKALGAAAAPFLTAKSGFSFYNTSPMDFAVLQGDAAQIKPNLLAYVSAFSENVRDVFERFDFPAMVEKLDGANLLFQIVQKFAAVDLHPDKVSNGDMGLIFEELIRRFAELSNETAGEHFTPREVIRLMVNLLFLADDAVLTQPGIVRTLYDPAAGTGGMLSIADEHLGGLNPDARLVMHGQELNAESYAICKADMLIKGQDIGNIIFGNTLSADGHPNKRFDYMLSNPPFGVEWKKVEKEVRKEHEQRGHDGRFGPGLPRVSDGSLLFLLNLLAKMRPRNEGGSRVAIVLNGSPLFTGGAGSGESDIRKWIIENDYLEAIVALPVDMFYNTGISTYIFVLSNHKAPERKGRIQLINAAEFFVKMRKSLGSKRKELSPADIERIVALYGGFQESEYSRIFANEDFGYRTITVERPLRLNFSNSAERLAHITEGSALARMGEVALELLKSALEAMGPDRHWKSRPAFQKELKKALARAGIELSTPQQKALLAALSERDEEAEVCRDAKGHPEPDAELRDTENVPMREDVDEYFQREVLPHVPDAWIDHAKTKVGYEIPFNRHFYKYVPPRPLEDIDRDLKVISAEIMDLLREVTE
jgi:type I restriction enzyme M protein